MYSVENIKSLIENEYNKIQSGKCSDLRQVYYNLIKVKYEYGLNSYLSTIYVDAKKYIEASFNKVISDDFGYDIVSEEKLLEVIELFTLNERMSLCNLILRKAKDLGISLEGIEKKRLDTYKDLLRQNGGLMALISVSLGNSIKATFVCYFVFLFIITIVIMPAPFSWMCILNTSLVDVSSNLLLNYVSNALIWLFGINVSPFNITPIGFIGVLVYCLGKIFSVLFIGNFLFQKLISFISRRTENYGQII